MWGRALKSWKLKTLCLHTRQPGTVFKILGKWQSEIRKCPDNITTSLYAQARQLHPFQSQGNFSNNNNNKIHILGGNLHHYKWFSGGPLEKKICKNKVNKLILQAKESHLRTLLNFH